MTAVPDELVLCLVLLEAQQDRPRRGLRVFARPRPVNEPAPTLTGTANHAEWRWVSRDDLLARIVP